MVELRDVEYVCRGWSYMDFQGTFLYFEDGLGLLAFFIPSI